MGDRVRIAGGMALGVVWSAAVIAAGLAWRPGLSWPEATLLALAPGGAVLAALIARLAAARFADPAIIGGQPFAAGSRAALTQRILSNTAEQLLLGACLWPLAGWLGGPGLPLALGFGFGLTRAAFWAGYAAAPPLRAFGFAGGFYPTLLAPVVAWLLV